MNVQRYIQSEDTMKKKRVYRIYAKNDRERYAFLAETGNFWTAMMYRGDGYIVERKVYVII